MNYIFEKKTSIILAYFIYFVFLCPCEDTYYSIINQLIFTIMYLVTLQSATDQNSMSEPMLVEFSDLSEYVEKHRKGNIIIIKAISIYDE